MDFADGKDSLQKVCEEYNECKKEFDKLSSSEDHVKKTDCEQSIQTAGENIDQCWDELKGIYQTIESEMNKVFEGIKKDYQIYVKSRGFIDTEN